VLWGTSVHAGVPPARAWLAAPEVCAALDTVVSRLSRRELAAVGQAHEQALLARPDDVGGSYRVLCARLLGWAVVSAASLPDLSLGGT
jgi:hypothetical protein